MSTPTAKGLMTTVGQTMAGVSAGNEVLAGAVILCPNNPYNTVRPDHNPHSESDSAIRVTEIRTLDQLRSVRECWLNLLDQNQQPDFFQSPYWLETYLQHNQQIELRALLIHQGQSAIGLLPFVVAPFKSSLGMFRVLTWPLDWWGTFYGPIGLDPNRTLRIGLAWIKHRPGDWDFLELRFMRRDSRPNSIEPNFPDETLAAFTQAGFSRVSCEPHFHCARINLKNTTWDEYLLSRRKSWKTNVRRTENKIKKLGLVEHIRFRPAPGQDDCRWDLYQECHRLSELSWQGKSDNTQTFAHPNVSPFLRAVHEQATRHGCVDMNLLTIDGKAVAYHYGYHWNGYFSSLRLGFDPAFARQGVGTVLTSRMIRDSIERGDHTFDFLPDCLDAKRPWQTSLDVGYRYTHFPVSVGRLSAVQMKRWIDRVVRKKSAVPD